MSTVCVVGSINLDLMVRVERAPSPGETILGQFVGKYPGGKGFNQAVAAHRSGAVTRFYGQVGDDDEGKILRLSLAEAGLSGRYLSVDSGTPTGLAQIAALPGSDNSIVVTPGANGTLNLDDLPLALKGADIMLVQMEIGASTVNAALAAGRAAGVQTVLNAAPSADVTRATIALADIVVVNETEAADLGGVDALLAAGPKAVVMTLGARGASWHEPGVAPVHVPAFAIEAADTTGAGDAFCGALAAALGAEASHIEALERASAAGAIVAKAVGAQTSTLSIASIAALIAERRSTLESA